MESHLLILTDGLRIIGRGQPLMVLKDGSGAVFAAVRPGQEVVHASADLVAELLSSGMLHKMSELGEPPVGQRKRGDGWRSGWRELGWDGKIADWYVLVQ
jgi:hypothetical protein